MRGLFVTATDTGVGKTILSAALLAAMAAEGERVRAHKPVLTGLGPRARRRPLAWPPDHELLAAAAAMRAEEVAPRRYRPAVSPHLAAALAGEQIDPHALIAAAVGAGGAQTMRTGSPALIIEGVGGLLTPLTERFTVCDLAAAVALPVLLAARPGLGTINHTLLALQAARAAGLRVRAVVLTPWPRNPSLLERSNRETIARMGAVEVAALGRVRRHTTRALARAGAGLPWREWLAQPAGDQARRARAGAPGARLPSSTCSISLSASPM